MINFFSILKCVQYLISLFLYSLKEEIKNIFHFLIFMKKRTIHNLMFVNKNKKVIKFSEQFSQ